MQKMKTKLDILLEEIDPGKTYDDVSARVDKAVNSFQVKKGVIRDWDTYTTILSDFFRHAENIILNIPGFRSPDPNFDWNRCCKLLSKGYGPDGDKTAFENVRTGSRGGLYDVLKNIAEEMIYQYAGNETSAKINHLWNKLSMDEQFQMMDEYILKYGHLLPSELTEGSAARIKVNFVKVLEEHPRMVRRMRNVGRI